MLTRGDFRYNFGILKAITSLKIIPLDLERNTNKLNVPKSPWKLRISLVLFGLNTLHGFYILFRLLQVLSTHSHEIVRHHLMFHVDILFGTFLLEGWYLSCFLLHPQTFVALFNDVFKTNDGHDDQKRSEQKARSRQEWLALAIPTLYVLIVSFAMCLLTYDRSMAFLLHSCLPENYQTPFWFGLLFSKETHLMAFIGSTAIFVLVAQILFFEKISTSLKIIMSSSELMCTEDMAEAAYRKLRKIQLQVNLFNNMNRYIAFSFKLFCITICTLNGYFMIVYFSADPMFGCMYYGIFGMLCMLYSIIYERAFAIPKIVRLTKASILLRAAAGLRDPCFKRKMKMRLRSVPEAGIQIGHFHTFERVATPIFVDYVLRNIMGLLTMHLS